jgi:hypothetical protein
VQCKEGDLSGEKVKVPVALTSGTGLRSGHSLLIEYVGDQGIHA